MKMKCAVVSERVCVVWIKWRVTTHRSYNSAMMLMQHVQCEFGVAQQLRQTALEPYHPCLKAKTKKQVE